jgi:hypothetical protein
MKKLVVATLAAFFATASVAQEVNPNLVQVFLDINCFKDIKPYIQELETVYGEKPLFVGRSILPVANFVASDVIPMEGILISYVNQDTGTFTNVMLFPDNSGCEVSFGNEFTPAVN